MSKQKVYHDGIWKDIHITTSNTDIAAREKADVAQTTANEAKIIADTKALDSNTVHKSGDEIISGAKKFTAVLEVTRNIKISNARPNSGGMLGCRFPDNPDAPETYETVIAGDYLEGEVPDEGVAYAAFNSVNSQRSLSWGIGAFIPSGKNYVIGCEPMEDGLLRWRTDSTWTHPSTKTLTLSLPATGGDLIMPADGWLEAACTGTASSTFLELVDDDHHISATASFTGGWARTHIPVSKGDRVVFYYGGANFVCQRLTFTYTKETAHE